MKKILLLLLLLLSVQVTFSKQIEVCENCKVSTLKEAINLAENGDSILIKKGTYFENNIEINKEVSIIGEEGVVIDGKNKGDILYITASNFSLKNIKVINVDVSYVKDYAAIKIVRSKNFTIENIVLEKVFFGILVEKSHYGIIKKCNSSSTAKDEANS